MTAPCVLSREMPQTSLHLLFLLLLIFKMHQVDNDSGDLISDGKPERH